VKWIVKENPVAVLRRQPSRIVTTSVPSFTRRLHRGEGLETPNPAPLSPFWVLGGQVVLILDPYGREIKSSLVTKSVRLTNPPSVPTARMSLATSKAGSPGLGLFQIRYLRFRPNHDSVS